MKYLMFLTNVFLIIFLFQACNKAEVIKSKKEVKSKKEIMVKVIIASKDIKAGVKITDEMLTFREIAKSKKAKEFLLLKHKAFILNLTLKKSISKNDFIKDYNVTSPKREKPKAMKTGNRLIASKNLKKGMVLTSEMLSSQEFINYIQKDMIEYKDMEKAKAKVLIRDIYKGDPIFTYDFKSVKDEDIDNKKAKKLFKEVVVASKSIMAGKKITKKMLKIIKIDSKDFNEKMLSPKSLNYVLGLPLERGFSSGTIIFVNDFIDLSGREPIVGKKMKILVASKNIKKGVKLKLDMFSSKEDNIKDGLIDFKHRKQYIGRVLLRDIKKGEFISNSDSVAVLGN